MLAAPPESSAIVWAITPASTRLRSHAQVRTSAVVRKVSIYQSGPSVPAILEANTVYIQQTQDFHATSMPLEINHAAMERRPPPGMRMSVSTLATSYVLKVLAGSHNSAVVRPASFSAHLAPFTPSKLTKACTFSSPSHVQLC